MKTLFDKIEKQTYVDRLELWKMGKLTPDGKYAAKPIFASALFRHLATHHDYKILRWEKKKLKIIKKYIKLGDILMIKYLKITKIFYLILDGF